MRTLTVILVGILLMTLTEPGFRANDRVAGAIFLLGGLLTVLGLLRLAQVFRLTHDRKHPWRDDPEHPWLSAMSSLWDLVSGLFRWK